MHILTTSWWELHTAYLKICNPVQFNFVRMATDLAGWHTVVYRLPFALQCCMATWCVGVMVSCSTLNIQVLWHAHGVTGWWHSTDHTQPMRLGGYHISKRFPLMYLNQTISAMHSLFEVQVLKQGTLYQQGWGGWDGGCSITIPPYHFFGYLFQFMYSVICFAVRPYWIMCLVIWGIISNVICSDCLYKI